MKIKILAIFLISALSPLHGLQRFKHPVEALKIAKHYLPRAPIIIEAGAYDGKETMSFFKIWPFCRVHAFEPIPENFQNVVRNTRKNRRVFRYQLALGDMEKQLNMYVSTEPKEPALPSQSSSLLEPLKHLNFSSTLFPYQIQVQCTTIDKWAHQHGIKRVDLLWLDMQGYELNALKASPHTLKTVKAILTEVEFVEAYKGQALYPEIKQWLESQGFTMIATNFTPDAPESWFGDALFIRNK